MTEVLYSPGSSSLSSVSSPNPTSSSLHPHTALGDFFQGSPQVEHSHSCVADEETNQGNENDDGNAFSLVSSPSSANTSDVAVKGDSSEHGYYDKEDNNRDRHQLSLLALLVALFRKSLIACKRRSDGLALDIGSPSDVRHVAHVTFDRFNGFLGLPVEIEPEVPRRAPSASANVFGVSTESMQLSYDPWGNSVPTILLMMQTTLYAQGGLQVEGIFRINPENSQEEYVREQLNQGTVPQNIDVHCLAGLIKAWFRELPEGVLDSLSSEQVMQCQSDEDCFELVRVLPSTESALLDWAVNLMADVVQHEHLNKMNVRNIAMVFAPNMTKMADPFTALMYAVQVMNFLKTLIARALRNREDSLVDAPPSKKDHFNDDGEDWNPSNACVEEDAEADDDVFDLVLTAREEGAVLENPTEGMADVWFSNSPDEAKERGESEGKRAGGVVNSEAVFGQSMVDSILKKEVCSNGIGNLSPPIKSTSEWAEARW